MGAFKPEIVLVKSVDARALPALLVRRAANELAGSMPSSVHKISRSDKVRLQKSLIMTITSVYIVLRTVLKIIT